ncbi:MAG TPA: hypothetical protein VFP14_03465 [Novosphingobium sp.]|nr:hypothetical protein [Novosphingobium sp.]
MNQRSFKLRLGRMKDLLSLDALALLLVIAGLAIGFIALRR